jgi:polar amino acid transport system substrate-binding protein
MLAINQVPCIFLWVDRFSRQGRIEWLKGIAGINERVLIMRSKLINWFQTGLLSLFVLITIVGLITACTATGTKQASTVAPDPNLLRVGVSTNAPPLMFKEGGTIVGLEADFAHEFAQYLGKSLQFVELDWEDQIPALLDNRIDIIMSGMTATALREVRIAFCRPYFRSGLMALIRNENFYQFRTGFFSIKEGSGVGAIRSTTGEYFVDRYFSGVKRIAFPDSKAAVKALTAKKIDIFIHDAPIILYLAAENESKDLTPMYSLLTEEYLAWGVRKQNEELLNSANNFLESIAASGHLQTLIQRWIPFTKQIKAPAKGDPK